MLVYGWDGPRNGVSRVADNDQQIRAVGTVRGGGGTVCQSGVLCGHFLGIKMQH